MNTSTKAKAAAFHRLHHTDQILLLPNCWDVLSAVVLKAAGAKAIATTSAGLAWAHGYADGEKLPVESLIHAVREITRIIDLPVTVRSSTQRFGHPWSRKLFRRLKRPAPRDSV
jgi:2-methylisocitrate lyase-like PEP mutase family enzyme